VYQISVWLFVYSFLLLYRYHAFGEIKIYKSVQLHCPIRSSARRNTFGIKVSPKLSQLVDNVARGKEAAGVSFDG